MTRTANAIALGLLFLAFGFGILLWILPSADLERPASAYSDGPSGRSVVFDTLRALDFETVPWTKSPGQLPETPSLLVMHEPPEVPPGYDVELGVESDETGEAAPVRGPVASPHSRRLRDPLHYLRFVAEGGTILLPATTDTLDFLSEELELERFAEVVELDEESAGEGLNAVLPTGETIELDWNPGARLSDVARVPRTEVVLADDQGAVVAVYAEIGRGGFYLIASDVDFLDNDSVEDAGAALLMVRIAEGYAKDRRVLFDEYVLGGWTPESPLELAFAPTNFPLSIHLAGLLALFIWAAAWARQFPRDPLPLGPVSATMRARGFAGVLTRAGRWDLLGRMLRTGVLRRLSARAGLRRESAGESGPEEPDPATVRAVLTRLFAVRGDEAIASATRTLTKGDVSSREDLEELGRELLRIERAALASTHTKKGDRWTD